MKKTALLALILATTIVALPVCSKGETSPAPAQKAQAAAPKTTPTTESASPEAKPEASAATGALTTQVQKVSYTMGVQIGTSLKRSTMEIDRSVVLQGILDVLDGKPLQMSEQEMRELMLQVRKERAEKQQEEQQKLSEENITKEKAFLEENGKKEGVVTLPSGLQYKVIQEGTGTSPTATDRVKVSFRCTSIEGKELEKSSTPLEFQVNKTPIKGWAEALQLMKPGAKWELYVPSALAFGTRGRRIGMGPSEGIGPSEMLIYEMDLLEVLPPGAAPSPTVAPPMAPPAAGAPSVPQAPATPAAPGGTP